MSLFARGFGNVERGMNFLGATVLVAMMCLVTANVFGRYLFKAPIMGALEFTEFFMVAIVYLSLSHTQRTKSHITIDILTSRFSKRKQTVCETITFVAAFLFFAGIAWQSSRMTIDAYRIKEVTFGTIEFPIYPSKLFVPWGSLTICVRLILDMITNFKQLRQRQN